MSSSTPVRRNGVSSGSETRSTKMPSNLTTQDSISFPLLPTSLETILLSIYPATLLLGSLFSLLDPSSRNAPYNPTTQSHPPDQAPSYFALKRNLVNLYFVKINWAWLTIAHFLFIFLNPINGPPGLVFTPRKLRGLARYAIVTACWFAVTQWFFGPALIDRGFRITGGACELADVFEGTGGKKELVTAKACKAVGGAWRGGHDISGHVFILVLSSAFLGMEVLPVLWGRKGLRDDRVIRKTDGKVARLEGEPVDGGIKEEGIIERVAIWSPVIVAALNWWMLLMTAAYFHTWFEKVCVRKVVLRSVLMELGHGPSGGFCGVVYRLSSTSGITEPARYCRSSRRIISVFR